MSNVTLLPRPIHPYTKVWEDLLNEGVIPFNIPLEYTIENNPSLYNFICELGIKMDNDDIAYQKMRVVSGLLYKFDEYIIKHPSLLFHLLNNKDYCYQIYDLYEPDNDFSLPYCEKIYALLIKVD